MLIQPEAVDFLISRGNGIEYCKKVLEGMEKKPLIISVDLLKEIFGEGKKAEKIERKVKVEIRKESIKEERFKILRDVTGNSTCEGKLKDFVDLFRNRFDKLSSLLKKRQEMRNAIPIKKV